MKQRPWPIILIAVLHGLAPLGNIIFNSLRSGRELMETWNFWYYALPKPLFISYVVLPPLAGIFIYICKRWSYWSYVGCLLLIFASNAYGFWTQMNLANFLALSGVLLVDLLIVAYFVAPSVRKVYFDPRMRWWETAPRYHFDRSGLIEGKDILIKNISKGGVLIETEHSFYENQNVELSWKYKEHLYTMTGTVVYQKPLGAHFGYGIRFHPTSETQNQMASLIKIIHSEGKIVQDRLPGPEDGFFIWLKNLIKNRQGLFPFGK